jgi:hypothetical protein
MAIAAVVVLGQDHSQGHGSTNDATTRIARATFMIVDNPCFEEST